MQGNLDPGMRPARIKTVLWLAAAALAFLGVSFVTGWIAAQFKLSLLASASVGQVGILLVALVFAFADGGGFRPMGLFTRWLSWEIAVIPGVIILHFVGSAITSVIATLSGQMDPSQMGAMTVFKEFANLSPGTFLGVALFLSIQVGIAEELLFRGYVITRLERLGLGAWPCILISALIFGLVHAPGYQLIASISKAIWFGIPTGAYFYYRRNLGPLIIAHGLMDFLAFVALYLMLRLTGGQIPGM